jgi:hypothetical protein
MLSEGIQESHPYEPNGKRFVIQTLCRVVAHAQSWDEVMNGCEALANALQIAKGIEGGPPRTDSQSAAALGQLKELRQQIREFEKGGGNGKTRQTPFEEALREDAQSAAVQSDHIQAQKGSSRRGEEKWS